MVHLLNLCLFSTMINLLHIYSNMPHQIYLFYVFLIGDMFLTTVYSFRLLFLTSTISCSPQEVKAPGGAGVRAAAVAPAPSLQILVGCPQTVLVHQIVSQN